MSPRLHPLPEATLAGRAANGRSAEVVASDDRAVHDQSISPWPQAYTSVSVVFSVSLVALFSFGILDVVVVADPICKRLDRTWVVVEELEER